MCEDENLVLPVTSFPIEEGSSPAACNNIENRSDRAIIGSIVTVLEEGCSPVTFEIVSTVDKEDKGSQYFKNDYYISDESPLGSALLQRKEGEPVTFMVANKTETTSISVQILRIDNSNVNPKSYFKQV